MISVNLRLAPLLSCKHSSFIKDPGGKVWTILCSNKWFGVRVFQSSSEAAESGSSETAQSGLEFRIDSTSVGMVASTSSSARLTPSIALKAVQTLHISLSQTQLAREVFAFWRLEYPVASLLYEFASGSLC